MAALTTTSGAITINASFTETVTSGLIVSQTLPTSISTSVNYGNNNTGATNIDLVVGQQLTLNASPTTWNLTSINTLDGTYRAFARVREFMVQNLGSAPVTIYANSASGVGWLPSSTTPLTVYNGTSTSVSATGGRLLLSDPWVVGASSGMWVNASSGILVFNPGGASTSINVIIAGTSSAG